LRRRSTRWAAPWAAALAAGLLLSGCAQTPKPPRVATAPAEPASHGKGTYKVGNPYQIDGVWYYPAEDFSYQETGIASWYGEQFHAKETANGEVFDLNALTAAHRTLPMPSIVQVTNLDNGRTLQLRVNDRGPFARGRIIDVSRRAAQLLGFEQNGTAKVRVKILPEESIQVASLARRNAEPDKALGEAPKAAPRETVVAESLPPAAGVRAAPPRPVAARTPAPPAAALAAAPAVVQVSDAAEPPRLPEKVTTVPVKPTQIYIQAGAFSQTENVTRVKARLQNLGPVKTTAVRSQGIAVYRVRLGPIASVDEADRLLARVVAEAGLPEARIVVE
jgi:peptidoglycan lytic transglycosylase